MMISFRKSCRLPGNRVVYALLVIITSFGCVKRIPVPEAESSDTVVIDRKEFLAMARLQGADSIVVPDSVLFKPDVIFPGDQLGISLYEKLPVSMERRLEIRRVDGRGMVFLLPMGSLKVGGLNTIEAEQLITQKLAEYVVSPHVELTITEREIGRKQVYIFGNVTQQGSHALRDKYRLLDLFSDAGGIQPSVLMRPIKVIRVSGDAVLVSTIDLNDILRRGRLDQNILLENNDIVYVPDKYLASTLEILGIVVQFLPWYYFINALVP